MSKWIKLEDFKIYDGGLWQKLVPGVELSEMVEVASVNKLGTEDGKMIFLVDKIPNEIKNLNLMEWDVDEHIYLGVEESDTQQTALLWTI